MSVKQYLSLIWARRWLVLIIVLVFGIAGTTLALRRPKQFTAEAQLVLDVRPDPMLGNFSTAIGMTTQLEVMKSEKVGYRAAELLLADKSPAIRAQLVRFARDKPLEARSVFPFLLLGSTAEAVRGSNIIAVTFVSQDGAFATAAANALAKAAIDVSVQLRVEPTRESADWLAAQTKILRSSLEESQAKLSSFQQERGIVVSDERMTQEMTRLNALESALVVAESQRLDVMGRQRNVVDESSPEIQGSSTIQSLRTQLSAAQTKLAEIAGVLGTGHPQRLQLEAQIAGLKQQLSTEVSRLAGSASVSTRASSQKVEELRAIIETQKKQVLALRSQRDQIAVLQRDIETAQRAYDGASQRAGQLALESQNTQTGVRLLSPAVDSADASQKKLLVAVMASFLVGLAVALATALALELRDWRVRTADDLRMAVDLPLIGVLRPAGARPSVWEGLPTDVSMGRTPMLPNNGASR